MEANKQKRKRFILNEKDVSTVLHLFKNYENSIPGISRKSGVPEYHIHKIIDNHINKKR